MKKALEWVEFAVVWCVARGLGWLPRGVARWIGAGIGRVVYLLLPRLRRTGLTNLELAMPEMTAEERERTLKGVYRGLGWQLAEFCRMERYTQENTAGGVRGGGLEGVFAGGG